MDKQLDGPLLPFKVGQLAESRSFVSGYRSAWFRCKIKDISRKKGNMDYALEFYDFPDDKIKSTRIYQIPPQIGRKRATKITKMLMLRPQYPPIYHESEVAQANTISGVTVVITGVWKVGDLVDWWTDGCYWFGRVTQILGDGKLQIELPPPPIGEGASYEVLCKDLRPSLDWSPEHGWSVLTSQEGEENYHPCARLIKPLDQAGLPIVMVNGGEKIVEATDGSKLDASFPSPVSTNALPPVDKSEHSVGKEPTRQPLTIATPKEETQSPRIIAAEGLPIVMVNGGKKIVEATGGSKVDASFPSPVSANALPPVDNSEHSIVKEPTRQPLTIATPKEETRSPRPNTDLEMGDGAIRQTGLSQRSGNIEAAGNSCGKDQYFSSGSAKKIRTGGNIYLNSMRSDTIEAPIMDLEELVNKVKWLKGILESGVPLPSAGRPPWKFVEHHGSSTPE